MSFEERLLKLVKPAMLKLKTVGRALDEAMSNGDDVLALVATEDLENANKEVGRAWVEADQGRSTYLKFVENNGFVVSLEDLQYLEDALSNL